MDNTNQANAVTEVNNNDGYMISRCVYAAWGLAKSLKERVFDVASVDAVLAGVKKATSDIKTDDRAAAFWMHDNFEDIQASVQAIYILLDMITELAIEVL